MATVRPLRGVHYNPEHVKLGGVLAPPYDVISDARREELYGRDLRNIVRIDSGQPLPGDATGQNDVYIRAAGHLQSWMSLGVLLRDVRPSVYVTDHEFPAPGGGTMHRRGLLVRAPARPWAESEVLPHEHTLRGPKEDRLALMRATRMQTSPVWAVWDRAPEIGDLLDRATTGPALLGGRVDGDIGDEKLRLWQVEDASAVAAIIEALRPSRLYIADGHHRFETAAAYATERRAAGDAQGADSQYTLLYLCASNDPALIVQPTHRAVLLRQGFPDSRDDLLYRLDDAWEMEPAATMTQALDAMRQRRERHGFVVAAPDGIAVLSRGVREETSPARRLDVAVLVAEVLAPCGIGADELAEGALRYSRDPGEIEAAVRSGDAAMGFCVNPCTTAQVLAVADAHEVMPQKSTYFYPKVPTGLVLSPL